MIVAYAYWLGCQCYYVYGSGMRSTKVNVILKASRVDVFCPPQKIEISKKISIYI